MVRFSNLRRVNGFPSLIVNPDDDTRQAAELELYGLL
jgi:hypothetical protein